MSNKIDFSLLDLDDVPENNQKLVQQTTKRDLEQA